MENQTSFICKYNLTKNKEYNSFDCSIDAEVFYDKKGASYIMDSDSIIDIDQGIPLYFFKTGINDLNK
jgi:hypothetical protein